MSEQTTAMTVRQGNLPAYLPQIDPEAIEQALAIGDMAKMSPEVRVAYYVATCQSVGLNPMTRPFDLIKGDDGSVRLYPNKVAAEQLRKLHRVSTDKVERQTDHENGLYIVTVHVSTPDGRKDEAQGIVDIAGKKGTALANALLKCETKGKRRATLSICGIGYEDSEDQGHPVRFDYQRGELQTESSPRPMLVHTHAPSDPVTDLFGDREPPLTQQQGGASFLAQINAAWQAFGLDDAHLASYWAKTCKRFRVEKPEQLQASALPVILGEVREWIAKYVPADEQESTPTGEWRAALQAASAGLPDTQETVALWQEIAAALNSTDTPDDVGQELLQRVQAMTTVTVGK